MESINSLGAMSQFWFHVETVTIDDSRKCQTLPVPSRAGGLPLIKSLSRNDLAIHLHQILVSDGVFYDPVHLLAAGQADL